MSTIKKILKFTPHFLKQFFRKTLIFLRKGAGFVSSRALYFIAGIFLALAIFGIQAAWNSTVSSGQPLTSALWNDVVNKLVELDNKSVSSGFCVFSRTQAGCPIGWTRDAAFDSRTIRGASSPGGTGGSDSHTHTGPSHTHTIPSHTHPLKYTGTNQNNLAVSGPYVIGTGGAGATGAAGTGATGGSSSWPPYMNVIVCCKN